ncbi:hypothetical protein [Klebsiella quasipneumoniae]|uniref:hypothetical protein n=1 Tax=Klebsiella quasipneumoniae TaxID=1463165 RepID=UPI0021480BA3|nr:hypothetical protein [Klebsiella quasipneumoniae]MCR1227551.1 hypothetical protein [Klebsiella quasipneumoniae]
MNTFWLDKLDRRVLLEPHDFYVSQAKQRLLSQFNEISREADEVEEQHYEKLGQFFDPDRDDPADSYEAAHQEGISHFIALDEMRNTVTLAMTASEFHQFDKALREKMAREFSHWQPAAVDPLIWSVDFPKLVELLEWTGIDIKSKPFYEKIEACHLLVNVYKHGKGPSHTELANKYPQYYPSYTPRTGRRHNLPRPEQLKVSEAQFTDIADAIREFWLNIPEFRNESHLRDQPEWFDKQMKRYDSYLNKNAAKKP